MYTEQGRFVIYHATFSDGRKKVGCTWNLENRICWYPSGTIVEILEVVEDATVQEAGDREWYWADRYGYPRGMHYAKSHVSRTEEQRTTLAKTRALAGGAARGGKIGGRIGVERRSGIHGLNEEEKLKNSSKGGRAAAVARQDPVRGEKTRLKRSATVQAYWDQLRRDPEALAARRATYSKADHQSPQARENHRQAALRREALKREAKSRPISRPLCRPT